MEEPVYLWGSRGGTRSPQVLRWGIWLNWCIVQGTICCSIVDWGRYLHEPVRTIYRSHVDSCRTDVLYDEITVTNGARQPCNSNTQEVPDFDCDPNLDPGVNDDDLSLDSDDVRGDGTDCNNDIVYELTCEMWFQYLLPLLNLQWSSHPALELQELSSQALLDNRLKFL